VSRPRKLFLSPEACLDLRAIDEPVYAAVTERLLLLRRFPELGVRLGGDFAHLRATTVEMFRIFYRVTGRGVEIVYIRHCKRKLPRLIERLHPILK
jgi:ParE toxin of type II toxin-antitoxin system, parDE